MTREHSPRPGAHWDTRISRTERIIRDDAPEPASPKPPSTRRERRALERALRRTHRKGPS